MFYCSKVEGAVLLGVVFAAPVPAHPQTSTGDKKAAWLSDITLVSSERKSFLCHQCVLVARSGMFNVSLCLSICLLCECGVCWMCVYMCGVGVCGMGVWMRGLILCVCWRNKKIYKPQTDLQIINKNT